METTKSRAELLEEYKKKKVLGIASNNGLNNNNAPSKPSKPASGVVGGHSMAQNIKKKVGISLQNSSNQENVAKIERKNSTLKSKVSGRVEVAKQSSASKSNQTPSKHYESFFTTNTFADDDIQMTDDSTIPRPMEAMVEDDFNYQDTIHLKIELEAKDSLVQELRAENLKLIEELKNVQNQLLDLKDRGLDFDLVNEQLQEKNMFIDELNIFVQTLKSQLEALSSRPNQYADIWIHAAQKDEQDSLLSDQLKKQLKDQLEEASLTNKELINELTRNEQEVRTLKTNIGQLQEEKDKQLLESGQKYHLLHQSHSEVEQRLAFQSNIAQKTQADLDQSLECIEKLDKCLDESQEKCEVFEKEICTLEEQYTSLSILSDGWKIENENLANALQESLTENQKLHETVSSQSTEIQSLQTEVNCLFEATSLLETETINLEKELANKEELLEFAQIGIYRLEQSAVIDGITQDAELVKQLTEALEQNKLLHSEIQKMELVISEQSEKLLTRGVEELGLSEQSQTQVDSQCIGCDKDIQTDLDLNYVLEEFSRTLRALKIADLSGNVMYQKSLSQYEYFQDQLQTLSSENVELQKIVAERQDLEKRLMKGLQAATTRANELELQLASNKKE